MAPYDIVRKMRASILVLGPLLARAPARRRVSLPGGCAIGNRPIDLHLKALEAFGAELEVVGGLRHRRRRRAGGLSGVLLVRFPVVSVGATENALMAAPASRRGTMRDRERRARARDRRPVQAASIAMGASIDGIGSETLTIEGRDRLHGATYNGHARSHRGGQLCLRRRDGDRRRASTWSARAANEMQRDDRRADRGWSDQGRGSAATALHVSGARAAPAGITLVHRIPIPGFATDMQAQFMAMLAARRRRQRAERDDLREPLHARPRARADGRRHSASTGHTAVVRGVEDR